MGTVEQIRERGYAVVEGIIPAADVGRIRDDIVAAADEFGSKDPRNTYLATTINYTQSFAPYVADARILAIVESFFGPHARVSSTSTQINERDNKRGEWHADSLWSRQ